MGIFQKLNSKTNMLKRIKYPYSVRIMNTPLSNDIEGVFFKYNNDNSLSFYTNIKTYRILNNKKLIINSNYLKIRNSFKNFLLRKWFSIISLLIIFFVLLFSNNYIKEINFSNEVYYSKDVMDFVVANVKTSKGYYRLNDNLNEISKKLRARFPYYEWIGLRKNGNILLIDIVNLEPILITTPNDNYGNLVAGKTAYIMNYHIESGVTVVDTNVTVKKGDLLVSGNLNYLNETLKEKWVCPSGYINGKTIEKIEIEVEKYKKTTVYTGMTKSKMHFTLGKRNNNNESPYDDFYYQVETLFKLGHFKLIKETYFEKKSFEQYFTEDEAFVQAKLKIETEFYQKARNPYEEVIKIEKIKVTDNQTSYKMILIVYKIENIAIFKTISST